MGPLVYYCRWRGAKLRLLGREGSQVWGLLVKPDEAGDITEPFRFDSEKRVLWLGADDDPQRYLLDEMGVVIPAET